MRGWLLLLLLLTMCRFHTYWAASALIGPVPQSMNAHNASLLMTCAGDAFRHPFAGYAMT
jgi:hypothetical protein